MSTWKQLLKNWLGIATVTAASTTLALPNGQVTIHVDGDGSHLAIIDAERYEGFVGDWSENDRLRKHLVQQASRESSIAWGTGFETDWVVAIRPEISDAKGFREFTSVISTRSGLLHLVDYDSLTMAAQFEDYRLPDKETETYAFHVPPGRYLIRVVQLVDPSTEWWKTLGEGEPAFLIEYAPAQPGAEPQQQIPWASF